MAYIYYQVRLVQSDTFQIRCIGILLHAINHYLAKLLIKQLNHLLKVQNDYQVSFLGF